mmetsp:Transcript_6294/g.25452  ORF Transcript_6294/g.25452 Transcript_6294/m.25452 type:complete len:221 (-) Transcript_6294:2629-3291(-)
MRQSSDSGRFLAEIEEGTDIAIPQESSLLLLRKRARETGLQHSSRLGSRRGVGLGSEHLCLCIEGEYLPAVSVLEELCLADGAGRLECTVGKLECDEVRKEAHRLGRRRVERGGDGSEQCGGEHSLRLVRHLPCLPLHHRPVHGEWSDVAVERLHREGEAAEHNEVRQLEGDSALVLGHKERPQCLGLAWRREECGHVRVGIEGACVGGGSSRGGAGPVE